MLDIRFQKPLLLFRGWVKVGIAGVRGGGVVVVVCPLREVVGKLEAWQVGCSVFEVDNDQLLMLIFGL